MEPERRCKSGMDGGLTAALLDQPAALSKNGRFFVQLTRTTSFGNAQTAQERFYLRSRIVWFDNLLHDIKFAIRQLIRNPSFTFVAIVTLGPGIAANSTIFSWINSTLLDPIPGIAHTSDMITIMRGERSEHPTPPFSYMDFVDLRDTYMCSWCVVDGNQLVLIPSPQSRRPSKHVRYPGDADVIGRVTVVTMPLAVVR